MPTTTDPNAKVRKDFPAKFNARILMNIADVLNSEPDCVTVLDPFAGVGGVHTLRQYGYVTYGIELEPEWARCSPYTYRGNAKFPTRVVRLTKAAPFDAIVTSPTYGNRMADHHVARDVSVRNTYTHRLGRKLHRDNAGAMQWGPAYRELHEAAWEANCRLLKPKGLFVLNIKDHVRDDERQRVTAFHLRTLQDLGLRVEDIVPVRSTGNRYGENRAKRIDAELIVVLRKEG